MTMTPIANRDLSFLVVEDNAISRQLVEFLLKSLGYKNILCAEDGVDALKKTEEAGRLPDVVMCDWVMPVMDGLDFLNAVRTKGFSGIFIMVTAVSSIEAAHLAKTHGADGYLLKPVTKSGLRKAIEDATSRGSTPMAPPSI